ncbi:hypothetical protein [Streptomyces antarcticus]|uniref:hypothetical protein n=1 Tax=Streptomyces antarcticus TaxID=2996458 RepID=UPI00226DA3D0|nr:MULTISPECIES: hypothetical protein [unclassified Streptomyces]MCY0942009.1 hypothetical protein [Streptomyces sp. H34-AA3]MCZ4082352.1 hypothetical protein [Streptomyces sp. H34-S5]
MESPISFEYLASGARDFGRLALEAHALGETEVFLLEAGVSIERLAKAALVRVNPVLLVELSSRQDDALLHLAGATALPKKLRTVGAQTAIERLRKMDVLPLKDEDLDTLIQLRNGVAHLGTSTPEDFLEPFVESVCLLVDYTGLGREEFWGAWHDLVRVALDDRADRLHKDVRLRLHQASLRARARFADMPEGTPEHLAAIVAQRGLVVVEVDRAGGPLFQALTRCPACQTEAAALFLRAPTTALLFDLELTAEGLWCDLCQLRLDTTEEVGLAGIATTARYTAEELIQVGRQGNAPAADVFSYAMRRQPEDSF